MGLRERKKEETRQAIREAALRLFFARGFDAVSVAEVAEAANVSKVTVFKYFPLKEDLVYSRTGEAESELARAVRGRARGESALGAVRRYFLEGLARRDPESGLNDYAVAFLRLIAGSPALQS